MRGKRICEIAAALIFAVFMFAVPMTVRADVGPKASVRVRFEHMGDELCYGTLLSRQASTGPQSAWDGKDEHIRTNDLDLDIWKAFAEYEDADGYYFLQIGWNVSETGEIAWTYYPPDSFKILLYYPGTDRYLVSDICERYAFDTYYTVDMEGIGMGSAEYGAEGSGNERIKAYRSYDYPGEMLSFIVRVTLTVIIEMAVALIFGFRKKKQLHLLIAVNTVTQIALNILLNVINYHSGPWAFVLYYVLLEMLIIVMEAAAYCLFMNRWTDRPKKKWFYIVYAFAANSVSFSVGILAAQALPGIF